MLQPNQYEQTTTITKMEFLKSGHSVKASILYVLTFEGGYKLLSEKVSLPLIFKSGSLAAGDSCAQNWQLFVFLR